MLEGNDEEQVYVKGQVKSVDLTCSKPKSKPESAGFIQILV